MEDQAVHAIGQIGERDLGLGALDADGADEQAHLVLLLSEDMLDVSANLGYSRIGPCRPLRHLPVPGLYAIDVADPTLPFEPLLVGLAAISRIGPDVGGGVVVHHDVPEHPPIEAGSIGDLGFADEAEGPADRDATFVPEARDGDVDVRLAVGRGLGLGELQRPARVGIPLRCPGGLAGPDLACLLALFDRRLLDLGVALLGRGHQSDIDDLPTYGEITPLLKLAVEIGKQRVEIATSLKDIGLLADRIAPLFITVDPTRDTPDRFASYLENFDTRIEIRRGILTVTDTWRLTSPSEVGGIGP